MQVPSWSGSATTGMGTGAGRPAATDWAGCGRGRSSGIIPGTRPIQGGGISPEGMISGPDADIVANPERHAGRRRISN